MLIALLAFMHMSPAGLAQLRLREAVTNHYYNDEAHNCTYGVGTLAHIGPCTPAELGSYVDNDKVERSFEAGVLDAESAVKRVVKNQDLTQQQFDALVSFTYNLGSAGAKPVLHLVNRGRLKEAAALMKTYVYVTMRNKNGKPVHGKHRKIVLKRSNALLARREEEMQSFL
jgi:lysozyme